MFLPFLSKNYKTGIIILHQKYYINYNYITITIFIIYSLYSYHNRWQLASENLIGTLCVVSGHFVFSFYIFLCLGNMFSIILCTMSNKILPYHSTSLQYLNKQQNIKSSITSMVVVIKHVQCLGDICTFPMLKVLAINFNFFFNGKIYF